MAVMKMENASLPWVKSLARIRTLADVAEGLSLVFIFGPGTLARQGLRQVVDAVAGKRHVLWHRLDLRGADISNSLAAAQSEPVVLLVHGMELVEPERRREIAVMLNTGRNALSSFNALVIFWIPESEREGLFRFCPDLLHWRTLAAATTATEVESYRQMSIATYDVFLSYASADKPAVEILARRLREDGLEPFLDTWHLVPGEAWQESLERALESSRTCAVFVGKKLGPWQNEEMRAALDERVRNANYRVIPVLLPGALALDRKDLPLFLRRLTWVDFRSGMDDEIAYRRLLSGIYGESPGFRAVTLSPYRAKLPAREFFVHRRQLDDLRKLVVDAAGSAFMTALRGPGGFGKTALARALCDEPEVREAYPDGILWTTMGEHLRDADRVDRVLDLVRWWTDEEPPGMKSARDAGDYMKKILTGQRVLVVVDDVWKAADLEPFRELRGGTILATTRNVRALPADIRCVEVDAMRPGEALALLAHEAGPVDGGRLLTLARRVGEWPLLLRLVKSQVDDLVQRHGLDGLAALELIESRLQKAGLRTLDRRDATERNEALSVTMKVSLDALSPDDLRRYLELAVFPEDTDVPVRIIERLWDLDDWEAEDLCHHFEDLSLLWKFDALRGTIRLHDVVREYLIGVHSDLPTLHRRLLVRCRPEGGLWSDLSSDETYLWRHLARHLIGAGEPAELRRLLLDLDYLENKLRAVGVNTLLADFDVLGEVGDIRRLQVALRLSSHLLARNWGSHLRQVLAGQLLVRLGSLGEDGRGLLSAAAESVPIRPRRATMNQPGGAVVRTFEGHTGQAMALGVLSETAIVSASADKTLRIWDVPSGGPIRTLRGHADAVTAVAVLDEERIVSASHDNDLRIWDVATGETILVLRGHLSIVTAVTVLDESHVISASSDETLRLWNTRSGELLRVYIGHEHQVTAAAVLDNRRMVSASFDQTLRVWEVWSGETLQTLRGHTSLVNAVAVLDRKNVISASADHNLRVWDIDSGESIQTLQGHKSAVNALAVLDRTQVISASYDGTLRVWNLDLGLTVRVLEARGVNAVVAMNSRSVVSASIDGSLHQWDLNAGTSLPTNGHSSRVNALAVLDEKRVVSASNEKRLRIWNIASGETIQTFDGHSLGTKALVAVNSSRAVSASWDSTLRLFNVESGELIRTFFGHTSFVNDVAVLDESHVVSASNDQTLRVWDLESGETIQILEGHALYVLGVAALDAVRVVSASSDKTLRVWDARSGETIRILEGHLFGVGLVEALDGKRVISASTDGVLRIWDIESGETAQILKGHTAGIGSIALVDQDHVVSASSDKTLRVWNMKTGEAVALFALDHAVSAVAVTADGRKVVAGDAAGGIHFFDLDSL